MLNSLSNWKSLCQKFNCFQIECFMIMSENIQSYLSVRSFYKLKSFKKILGLVYFFKGIPLTTFLGTICLKFQAVTLS